MQAIGRQPQRAPDGAPVQCERHRPEQTTLYHLVQQHAASVIAHTEASTGDELPRFIQDEFDAFLGCGILAHGFLRLRCGECSPDKPLAFGCKRRGFCPSCGARRLSQTAAHLVDPVIPRVPVRPWLLSLPIPPRLLLAAQPERVTPVRQVVQCLVTHRLDSAGLKADEGHGGAVTLIQRFGSAAKARHFRPSKSRLGPCPGPLNWISLDTRRASGKVSMGWRSARPWAAHARLATGRRLGQNPLQPHRPTAFAKLSTRGVFRVGRQTRNCPF